MPLTRTLSLTCAALLMMAPALAGQSGPPPRDLSMATLEELLNIEITSASRVVQRADSVPAAVFVLTHDDIRRSGMTRLPDVLRLVPGVHVATISASKSAVSVRGFNDLYADKLLVLVDGRTIYNRMFSGVFWDTEDLMLENLDRIEVIRGPGASVWGANAVNGVINIVTRSSADTQGTLVRVGAGTSDENGAAIRHGGAWGAASYRAYAQWTESRESRLPTGGDAGDGLRTVTGGFRIDRQAGRDELMLDGRLSAGRAVALWLTTHPAVPAVTPATHDASTTKGGALLARWTRRLAGGRSLQVQSSFDEDHRDEPIAHYHRRGFYIDGQFHARVGGRHDVVTGGGFRWLRDLFDGRSGYAVVGANPNAFLVSAFVQDEIALVRDRLFATVGTKIEHSSDAEAGVQPTGRLMWHVVPHRQHLWGAVSRALRTPSLYDRALLVDYPPQVVGGVTLVQRITGNPDYRTEEVVDVEAGYRAEIGRAAAVDVAAYRASYDHLRTLEVLPPVFTPDPTPRMFQPVQFDTRMRATTHGVEILGQWQPTPGWRVDASYSAFRIDPTPMGSRDPNAARYRATSPHDQWQVHVARILAARIRVDALVFHAGAITELGVPAYTRADARVELRLTPGWVLAATGHNLLDPTHIEYSGQRGNYLATSVPRSGGLSLTWRH